MSALGNTPHPSSGRKGALLQSAFCCNKKNHCNYKHTAKICDTFFQHSKENSFILPWEHSNQCPEMHLQWFAMKLPELVTLVFLFCTICHYHKKDQWCWSTHFQSYWQLCKKQGESKYVSECDTLVGSKWQCHEQYLATRSSLEPVTLAPLHLSHVSNTSLVKAPGSGPGKTAPGTSFSVKRGSYRSNGMKSAAAICDFCEKNINF